MGAGVSKDDLTSTLSPYAKKTDLTIYAKTEDISSTYAKAADVDLSSYAKSSDVSETYAKASDLSSYAKTLDLTPFAKTDDISTTYAKTADVDSTYAKKTDLTTYAKTADVASTYAKTADVASKLFCPSTGDCKPVCRPINTEWNDAGGGSAFHFDRHNLQCQPSEYLNRFYYARNPANGNQFRLEGNCCRIWDVKN